MRQFIATSLATLAAALAPALAISAVFLAFGGKEALPTLPLVFFFALFVAFLHTLLLGLLAAGWLLRVGKFRFLPMLLSGLMIGMVPAAVWNQPYKYAGTQTSSWSNGVQKLENGVPTLAGWVDYLQFVGYAGLLGAIGAVAFYLVYKGMSPNNSFKPSPLRGLGPTGTASGGPA